MTNSIPEESQSITFLGDFSKKLATNTFFNFVSRCWNFTVTFLLTPYILWRLGAGEFGVWVLLSILTSSFNLLDLGIGSAFVKHISEYYTRRDYDRINKALSSGFIFYIAFGAALVVLGLALEGPLFRLVRIPDGYSAVFLLVLIAFACLNISNLFLSALRGIQRMDKSSSVEIKMTLPSVLGTVIFLESGFGILGLALNAVAISTLTALLGCWTLKSVLPELALRLRFDGGLLREMFGYGAKLQVSRLGDLVGFHIDKVIISRFFGPATVAFYEVGARLAAATRAIPLVMISGLIPATSELDARNDREKILRAYLLASKYVSILTVALVAIVALEAGALLHLWLGHGFEQSTAFIQLLVIGYGANIMGGPASQTAAGIGRPEFDMKSTGLRIVLSPVLGVLLVTRLGPAGAAAGGAIAMVAAAAYLIWIFHRDYLTNSAWTVIRDAHLRPILSGVLACLAVLGFSRVAPQTSALEAFRYLAPVKIALDVAIFSSAYVLLLIAFRQVTRIDRNNLMGLLAFGAGFLRHPLRERVKIYR